MQKLVINIINSENYSQIKSEIIILIYLFNYIISEYILFILYIYNYFYLMFTYFDIFALLFSNTL